MIENHIEALEVVGIFTAVIGSAIFGFFKFRHTSKEAIKILDKITKENECVLRKNCLIEKKLQRMEQKLKQERNA